MAIHKTGQNCTRRGKDLGGKEGSRGAWRCMGRKGRRKTLEGSTAEATVQCMGVMGLVHNPASHSHFQFSPVPFGVPFSVQ